MKKFKRLLARIPTKLPQGMTEFETWSNSILDTFEMPNNDSTKFALAVQILHLKSDEAYKSKAYFGKTLIKGAASQIAGEVMNQCKTRQELKAKTEDTASQDAVSGEAR